MAPRKKTNIFDGPTEAQVAKFEMVLPMLESARREMLEFAKKTQNGIVNATKIKLLNRLLKDCKEILVSEPTSDYLDVLDEVTLPQNSDVVLIIGQFLAAMRQFEARYKGYDILDGHRWFTQENPPNEK